MFVMNTLRKLVLRLNYKQNLDLGGLNTRNLVQCLQYSILIPHQKCSKKGGNICYIKLFEDNFSLKGTIQCLRKGER